MHETLCVLFIHWLLLLSYILLLCCTDVTKQLYVTSGDSTSCPSKPCLTLSELAKNTSQYIAPNTVVKFLPGRHLNTKLVIKDVGNISLIGSEHGNNDSKCVIQCTASAVGFGFRNVTHLRISQLAIFFC